MIDSILTSVKKIIGAEETYTHFDPDIIMHINTVLIYLYQIGIGKSPFTIRDSTAVWSDFLESANDLELVKTYVGLKVKMIFDPPTSSVLKDAILNNIAELEWRISVSVDPDSSII